MDKAVLYIRLSKEDLYKIHKGDDSESIMNQQLILTNYAVEHRFQIVDIYIDEDYSGLYDDRPEFDRLINDGKVGKFNIIIAKSQSRLTRNMEHVEKYIHHDFPALGIRFIGVVDGIDTNIRGNKKARQIYGLTNEWYCEDLSESIRSVFKQKMKSGQFLGGFAPYGYIKDPEDRHKFLIDEEAAEVVKRIFHLYIQGYSIRKICNILEDEGILNPTAYKKKQGLSYANKKSNEFSLKYNLWSESTIKRILGNETYLGKLIQGTCEKLSYKDKKVVAIPKDKWIIVENQHVPIIDSDLFNKASALRGKRRVSVPCQTNERRVHIFAGKLRCQSCGSTMIKSGKIKGKQDWYLRCQLANKSRRKECSSHNITYSVIEQAIFEQIQKHIHLVISNEGCKKELSKYIQETNNLQKQIEEKENKLKEIQSALSNHTQAMLLLYQDRAKSLVSETLFWKLKNEMEAEVLQVKQQETFLHEEIKKLTADQPSKQPSDDLVHEYYNYSMLTHEMVVDFIDYIEVGERDKEADNQELVIHWNF